MNAQKSSIKIFIKSTTGNYFAMKRSIRYGVDIEIEVDMLNE